jgi:flagellar motor protein MotB
MDKNTAQTVLQAATQLAAAGKYAAATALLNTAGPDADLVERLLLRAKIAAQQQCYHESITHWQQALTLEPANETAQQGLARAQELHGRRGRRFYLRANLYYALLLAVIGGLAVALFLVLLRGSGSASSEIAALRAAQEQNLQLTRQLSETLSAIRSNANSPAATTSGGLKIDVPGVIARQDNRDLLLSFADGLFEPGGNVLRPAAKQTLSALGRQLDTAKQTFSIGVAGYTDNVALPKERQDYRDNSALALARAVAVVEHLRAHTRLPGHVFTVQGLGGDLTPYPNDTPDNRRRNRTVVLRITTN